MFVRSVESRKSSTNRHAKPYCECWSKRGPMSWKRRNECTCGESCDANEWKWQHPDDIILSRVVVSDDQKQVTFHPLYSSGTAAVKGDTPLLHNHHYYWEVKMLTETYGTDIMVGIGTNKVDISDAQFEFTSLLGQDSESYGLSYTGAVRHNATVVRDSAGFCRGTIVGVMVDMWQGTLEFYLNRKPQGISFYNLRRHQCLYPIICSTAAQSSLRLIYASSWRASLLVDAAKILASSVSRDTRLKIPPGIWYTLRSNFWITLPHGACILDENEADELAMVVEEESVSEEESTTTPASASVVFITFYNNPPNLNFYAILKVVVPHDFLLAPSELADMMPGPYMNGFYVDNVERDYRIVLYE